MKIILASTSPRRKEMLGWLNLSFTSVDPGVDETQIRHNSPDKLALLLSQAKAAAVAKNIKEGIIIGSDTVIALDGHIIEKPLDTDEQRHLINMHRNRPSTIISGVTVIVAATGKRVSRIKKTSFTMADITEQQIEDYIKSGQGLGKGGGFGIQDEEGMFVGRLEGCYTNSIGFPLCTVASILQALDVEITVDVSQTVKAKTGRKC